MGKMQSTPPAITPEQVMAAIQAMAKPQRDKLLKQISKDFVWPDTSLPEKAGTKPASKVKADKTEAYLDDLGKRF